MAFKIVTLIVLVASVNAGVIAPAGFESRLVPDADYDPNPQYSYAYDVQDSLTGDYKQQQESRSGDSVQGSYSLIEADGTRRIVEYTADPENGFNAIIRKEDGLVRSAVPTPPAPVLLAKAAAIPSLYPAPIAKIAPATYAPAPAVYAAPAPAIAKVAAPIAYAAPITHVSYSTPLFSYSH